MYSKGSRVTFIDRFGNTKEGQVRGRARNGRYWITVDEPILDFSNYDVIVEEENLRLLGDRNGRKET